MKTQNNIKRFFKTSLAYFIGSILTKIIAFLLIPIYTSALKPEEFGSYDLVISIINIVSPLAFIQIWDGIFRFSFDKDENRHKNYIINNGIFISFIGIFVFIVFDLFLYFIYPEYINVWVFIYGILYSFEYIYTVIARVNMDNVLFSLSGVVNSLIAAIMNIILIKYLKVGVNSLYIAASAGIILQIIIIETKYKPLKNLNISDINKKCLTELIKFSFPLCISAISYWMLNGFSKVLISEKLGIYENGLYAIANKFSGLILLIVGVFQFAWNEYIYVLSVTDKKEEIYQKGIRFIFTVNIIASIIFMFISKILFIFLVDKQYFEAIYLIPVSIWGVSMSSFASFTGTLFLAGKKSNIMLYTTLISVLFNVILSFLLISKYKLFGALISLGIALSVMVISRLLVLYNQYKIKLSFNNYLIFILFVFSIILFYFNNSLLYSFICIISFMAISLFFIKNELQLVINMLLRREK